MKIFGLYFNFFKIIRSTSILRHTIVMYKLEFDTNSRGRSVHTAFQRKTKDDINVKILQRKNFTKTALANFQVHASIPGDSSPSIPS